MHSKFAPSKMSRIVACPGSIQLCEQVPQRPTSVHAEEGTMLHSVMADLAERGAYEATLSLDQKCLANDAWEYICALREGLKDPSHLALFEAPVMLERVPEVWGTADVVLFSRGHLHVADYKFGRTPVKTENNYQLITYGLGGMDLVANSLGAEGQYEVTDVTLHIIQPRLDPIDPVTYSAVKMKQFEVDIINAVATASGPEPALKPGVEQCQFCDANAICPARFAQAQDAAKSVFAHLARKPVTVEEIKEFYDSSELVLKAIKAIKDYLVAELIRGKPVQGLKLVRSRSTRAWSDEQAAAKWLMDNFDSDDIMQSKLISPAQIEKLYKRLKKDPNFLKLIVKKEGSIAMVDDKDPRPAVALDAATAFKELVNGEEN